VANNEIDETKNAGKLMAISMAMAMQWYDVWRGAHRPIKHIQGFTRSHWMPIAPTAAMVDEFE
jgi:hypothetical protein